MWAINVSILRYVYMTDVYSGLLGDEIYMKLNTLEVLSGGKPRLSGVKEQNSSSIATENSTKYSRIKVFWDQSTH